MIMFGVSPDVQDSGVLYSDTNFGKAQQITVINVEKILRPSDFMSQIVIVIVDEIVI